MDIIHEGWKIVNTVISGVSFQEVDEEVDRHYTLKTTNNNVFTDLTLVLEALSLSAPGPYGIQEGERLGTKRKPNVPMKLRRISELSQLEIGRHYKTEKGIPVMRVSLHDLEIAGKIRLPISTDDDNGDWRFSHNEPTNVTLRGIFNPTTAIVAIETFSGKKFSKGLPLEVEMKATTIRDVNPKERRGIENDVLRERPRQAKNQEWKSEFRMAFQLSELKIGVWYIVAETDVKIHPLSKAEFYISYRRRNNTAYKITLSQLNINKAQQALLNTIPSIPAMSPWTKKSAHDSDIDLIARQNDKENRNVNQHKELMPTVLAVSPFRTKQRGLLDALQSSSPTKAPSTPRSSSRAAYTPTDSIRDSSPSGSGSKRKRERGLPGSPFSPFAKESEISSIPLQEGAIPEAPVPPPAPPAPPGPSANQNKPKRKKLRPLHWNSIPQNKLESTIWGAPTSALVNCPSIDLDVTELESIFSVSPRGSPKAAAEKKAGGPRNLVSLLSLQRVNNIAILLSHFKLSFEEIHRGIMTLDESILSLDNIKALCYIAPREDEAEILRTFKGDVAALGEAERFLFMLLGVPRLLTRLETFLWKLQFPALFEEISQDVDVVINACNEVRNSDRLAQILKVILQVGGILNRDSYLSATSGFKMESLALLTETKGKNRSMNLLQYLKKELTSKKTELLTFYQDFKNVELASKVPVDHVRAETNCLKKDLIKLGEELKAHRELQMDAETSECPDLFASVMQEFYEAASADLARLDEKVNQMQQTWHDLAEYFGEDAAKCNSSVFFSNLHHFLKQFEDTTI